MNLQCVYSEGMDRIDIGQNSEQWRIPVDTVIKVSVR
jgi:hypothetical protein